MDIIRAPIAESNEKFLLRKARRTALRTLKTLERTFFKILRNDILSQLQSTQLK